MTYQPATSLPTGQKMALLMLRRGELANAILEHLREMSVPIPAKSDWAALIEQNRIMRHHYFRGAEQHSRLVLTPGGMHSASDIMRNYAQRFGIHGLVYTDPNGNHSGSVRCTCGWGTYGARTVLSRYAGEHLEQAKQGTLPAAYAMARMEAAE